MLISLLGLIVYSNTLNVPFQWDEDMTIVDNPIVKDLRYFLHPSGAKGFGLNYYSFRARYAGYLTFALNYKFHGLDVRGYHVVNTALHILNALLVYALLRLTLRTQLFTSHKGNPPLEKGDGGGFSSNYIPLFVALIFVSHPVQTEAVTYIMGRLPLLMWFFYLSSMVLYAKWRLKMGQHGSTIRQSHGSPCVLSLSKNAIYYLLSLLSAVLAMKTKENAFTLPFSIALYEFLFFPSPKFFVMPEVSSRASMLTLTDSEDSRQQHAGMTAKISKRGIWRLLYLAPFALTLLIIPLSLLSFDKPIGEVIGGIESASRHYTATPRMSYLFTQFRVLVTYLRLLVLPVNQNFDYDYPLYDSFFNPQVLASFLFLLSIFSLGIFFLIRSKSGNPLLRLLAWGIFWFFLTLSVESSLLPIPLIISEYRLYAPSVGIFLAVISTLFIGGRRRLIMSALVVATLVLSAAAYGRNTVWGSRVGLWEDVVRKSMKLSSAHNQLAIAYATKGRVDNAIEHFEITLGLNPSNADAYNNLGAAYETKGLTDKAIKHYAAAIKIDPTNAMAHNNLGVIYEAKGLIDEAEKHLYLAIRLKPDYAKAHYNLGLLYMERGMMDRALREFEVTIWIDPAHYEARRFLHYIANQGNRTHRQ